MNLLPFQFFLNNEIRQTGFPHIFHAFLQALHDIQLAAALVVTVRSHADDEPVPQFPGSLQQIHVPRVQQIKGSVSNNRFHGMGASIRFP